MKSIFLCINIHIPFVYHKHPFSEIKLIGEFNDFKQTKKLVTHLASNKILPFLGSVRNLREQFGNHFNMAMSISGNSINLLEKHALYILDEIKFLSKDGVFEFLAEPWSNSILSYFVEKELIRQTDLHQKTIQTFFGQVPTVFNANSALNPVSFTKFTPFPFCQTVLTNSNHLANDQKHQYNENLLIGNREQFLVNNTLSNNFQQVVSDDFPGNISRIIAPVKRYIRKHVSLINPLILFFNPLAENISSFKNWEAAVSQLIDKAGISFYSLTDLEDIAKYFSIENNHSKDMLMQFSLRDDWMKNNMQKEAFRQFSKIYKTIRTGEYYFLPEAWEYLQDINNYFYMSDSFFMEEFAKQNFTPYRSPHEAFTSYMNAASNFWNVNKNKQQNKEKTHFSIIPAVN